MDNRDFLRLENVNKKFMSNAIDTVELFRDFNLSISENQFLSIVGSNGSGKTTLLNLICGNLPIDSGAIYLKDKCINKLAEYQRSAHIGRVFQDPSKGTCPSLTILENMALADNKGGTFGLTRGISKKRIDYFKSQLSLLHIGLENRIDTLVGTLSGGQRQALSLLISTMTPLDVLVLDEHTAALDPKASENVMELTERFVREKKLTTIMVTHNLRHAAAYGDRLIMMHEGSIVLDKSGHEKEICEISDLLTVFNEISIECGN